MRSKLPDPTPVQKLEKPSLVVIFSTVGKKLLITSASVGGIASKLSLEFKPPTGAGIDEDFTLNLFAV